MGANLGGRGKKTISEINITPFVDVMLVLLVIFMVTAPFMLNGIKIQLPKTSKVERVSLNEKDSVVVSYTKDDGLYLGKDKVDPRTLVQKLRSILKKNQREVVYLRADYIVKYGEVAEFLSFLKSNGVQNVSLVTEIKKKK